MRPHPPDASDLPRFAEDHRHPNPRNAMPPHKCHRFPPPAGSADSSPAGPGSTRRARERQIVQFHKRRIGELHAVRPTLDHRWIRRIRRSNHHGEVGRTPEIGEREPARISARSHQNAGARLRRRHRRPQPTRIPHRHIHRRDPRFPMQTTSVGNSAFMSAGNQGAPPATSSRSMNRRRIEPRGFYRPPHPNPLPTGEGVA